MTYINVVSVDYVVLTVSNTLYTGHLSVNAAIGIIYTDLERVLANSKCGVVVLAVVCHFVCYQCNVNCAVHLW